MIKQSDRLAGKVALVVAGGARGDDPDMPGTGEAIARCLAASGASVAVVGRTKERSERTVERIGDTGTAIAVLADTTDRSACESAVEQVVKRFGRLDTVVNNLGVSSQGSIANFDEARWDQDIAGNLKAPLYMTSAALEYLRAAEGASVLNISSVAGTTGSGSGSYGTTKAAMIALTREMAVSLGRDGSARTASCPATSRHPWATPGRDDARQLRKGLSPLGIEGTGWDIGWAAVYLASDEAKYVTGVTLLVDGGVTEQLAIGAIFRMGFMQSYR